MTTDMFENQLATGLSRLAAEAEIPSHDADSILRPADVETVGIGLGRRAIFIGAAAACLLVVGLVVSQAGRDENVVADSAAAGGPANETDITSTTAADELSLGGVPVTAIGPGPDYSYQLTPEVAIGWASENGQPTNFCWRTPAEEDCGSEPTPGSDPIPVALGPDQTLTIVPVAADGSMPETAILALADGTTIEAPISWATDPISIGHATFDAATEDVVSTSTAN